ncbi:hypothetical protein BDZ97DRAFT_2063027 [Flammula alnicola]|nr:hypothetical protein BDZ97DRAFT_2063027 [Flammula alnicola]
MIGPKELVQHLDVPSYDIKFIWQYARKEIWEVTMVTLLLPNMYKRVGYQELKDEIYASALFGFVVRQPKLILWTKDWDLFPCLCLRQAEEHCDHPAFQVYPYHAAGLRPTSVPHSPHPVAPVDLNQGLVIKYGRVVEIMKKLIKPDPPPAWGKYLRDQKAINIRVWDETRNGYDKRTQSIT